ncbi:unnamed protein product [Paramecium octaurelia]|uniref:Membrane insertase YidC/Oxa/ALB C-terminal domain-containing protein n=1 Tax=Paramecium octaurelia TaxID=43137 RepID=A0A8S1RZH2_PAROT|nr:unnamed protein product [Paramecium octaurelia]
MISRSLKLYKFSTKIPTGVFDFANVQQGLTAPSSIMVEDLITRFSAYTPTNMYNSLDEYSRELLLYLANDLSWGMGWGILAISMGIKIAFTPLMFSAQLNACRMKLIEPESKNFQNMIQRAMRAQDFKASRAAQKQFKLFKRKHNINMLIPGLSILQMPFLFTWFLSLRYVCSLPDKYEGLKSQGFLWFQDLSEYDPYGILPIMSSFFTFWNISLNPNMQSQSTVPFAKYYRYVRFLPFFSIPVVIFFPAGVNLYWCSSALCHLIITALARQEKIRKIFGIPKYLPGTILERQNNMNIQTIVKAVVQDRVDLNNDVATTTTTAPPQKQVQTDAQHIMHEAKSGEQKVKIFASKPKKQK